MKRLFKVFKNICFLLLPSVFAMIYSSLLHKDWGWVKKVLTGERDLVQ